MEWHAPGAQAWQQAKERGVPVVLLLEAEWCPLSRRFREGALADPAVRSLLLGHFVSIRADAGSEPELDARFGSSGWPTLAWIDPEGNLLERSGPRDAAALRTLLERWRDRSPLASEPDAGSRARFASISREVMERLLASADPKFGGWGTRQKFPHPEALHFALVRWSREGDRATLQLVNHTLQYMQAGAIHDRVEGGFFRYARTADWSEPHYQKMLGSNAQRLLAYAEAYQALGTESFRETALGIQAWMEHSLLDPATGAFRASQDEDAEYYHLPTREARIRRKPPETDPWIYTDRNGDAVCALLKAGLALGREDFLEQALTTLDFLVTQLYRPGRGVAHGFDGMPKQSGFLKDQAALLRALTWAMHYVGSRRYMGTALELAEHTLHAYGAGLPSAQRPKDGSLADRLHDIQERGSLGERPESLEANAMLAEGLLRLSYMADRPDLRRAAETILQAFANDWPRFGNGIAGYGRAVDLCVHEPVQITIVGSREDDATRALRRSALAPYIASRVVQTLNPVEDADFLQRSGWPLPDGERQAVAYLHQAGQSYGRTSDPASLPALMIRLGRSGQQS